MLVRRTLLSLSLAALVGCTAAPSSDPDANTLDGGTSANGADSATPLDDRSMSADGAAEPPMMDGAAPQPDSGAPADAQRADVATSSDGGASAGCPGYATRYWDCCKAHCGWSANAAPVAAVRSCSSNNTVLAGTETQSSCSGGDAHTCFSMAPWAVNDTLSYGYAAVPANSGICGRCYQLSFDGTGHYDAMDPGSRALAGRTMIVQATNIGHDVSGGQFDVLIPGGGVGAFNACSRQWGVSDAALGAQYGGFLTTCRAGGGGHDAIRACVRARCESVFADARFADLRAGCLWFVNWYQAADNPNLRYREVPCPDAIVMRSGVDRRPIGDVQAPMCGASSTCTCDCSWANGGATCGTDDGSCCWRMCCGGR